MIGFSLKRSVIEMKQSLVIGAAGLVGGHIIDCLVSKGEIPFGLSRFERAATTSVTWFRGDLLQPASLSIPPASTLYCTALAEYLVVALPHLISPALKRVVVVTSTSIVTKIDSGVEAERESLRRYAEAETRIAEICEQNCIEWTILRPTLIYEEGKDGNITRVARLIRRWGFFPLVGRGEGLRQPVHAQDVAIGAVVAASSHLAVNRTYAIPGGETLSYREMIGRVFDGLQQSRRIISIPPIIWPAVFALAKRWLPNANVAMGSRMSSDMVFDGKIANQDFGWAPRAFRLDFDGKC